MDREKKVALKILMIMKDQIGKVFVLCMDIFFYLEI